MVTARTIAVTRCCLGRLEKAEAAASDSGIRSIVSLEKDSSKSSVTLVLTCAPLEKSGNCRNKQNKKKNQTYKLNQPQLTNLNFKAGETN